MPSTTVEHRWRWRIGAALLILIASALHVAYLINDCPLDLAPDEAHYWDWSRHLDWSYYSKGPLVALLIRGSCELFGPWAEVTTGTIMPAIRFPAILCGALLLAGLYTLTALTLRRESLAFGAVALALTQPIVAAASSLMTIDAPFTACWMWALVFAYLAAFQNRRWAWIAAGIVIAVGILAKYTMVLFVPSLALFLMLNFGFRTPRSALRTPQWRGFLLMCAIASLAVAPIVIWNAQHDWVTLRHVGGQAGGSEPFQIRWLGPFTFLGGQFAIMLGFWFVVWAAAMWHYRPRWSSEFGIRNAELNEDSALRTPHSALFLWCMAAPTFAVFFLLSLKSSGQVNWPVAMYLSGGVLAAAWLVDRSSQRVWRWGTVATATVGLMAILVVHYPALSRPVLVSIAGPPTLRYPLPIRKVDPTARLRGYRTLAAAVDRLREQARGEAGEPLIAATFWNMPGALGAYCDGHPTVYSFGPALYDRRSQLDFWRPNPVWDPEEFKGRTFVIIGDFTPQLLAAFDRIELPQPVVHSEGGEPVALWHMAIGWGFRGFGPVERLNLKKNY